MFQRFFAFLRRYSPFVGGSRANVPVAADTSTVVPTPHRKKVLFLTQAGNMLVAWKVREASGWYLRRPGHARIFWRGLSQVQPR